MQRDVAQAHVFNLVARHAADDGRVARVNPKGIDVAYVYALHASYRGAFGAPHPRPQPQEYARVHIVAHGYVAYHHVFYITAVNAFDGQAAAVLEQAVGYGNVLEATARFCSNLYAPCPPSVVGRLGLVELPRGVCHGVPVVPAYEAVGYGHVLSVLEVAQRKRCFQHDGIVPWRVDAARIDAHILAAVNVEAVAVGVYFNVADGQVVHPSGQQRKVSALNHAQVAEHNVAALLQGDGFVAYARAPVAFSGQPFAYDVARPADGDVVEPYAPYQ